jgi:hypothetical protein
LSTDRSDQEPPKPQLSTETKTLLLLDDIAVRLGRLEKIEASLVPMGKLESATITLNPGDTIIDLSTAPEYQIRGPWASVTITNDGGSNVSAYINDSSTPTTVKPDETRVIDMKARGKISRIRFTVTGQTMIRFDGVA